MARQSNVLAIGRIVAMAVLADASCTARGNFLDSATHVTDMGCDVMGFGRNAPKTRGNARCRACGAVASKGDQAVTDECE